MLLTRRAPAVRPVIRGGARFLTAARQPELRRPQPPSAEAEAAFESGMTRLQGRDYAGAAQAFERASERGSARGALHAALAHDGLLGGGAPSPSACDPRAGTGQPLAAEHYQRAAEAGNSEAMCHLALCCRDGRGTARDAALGFAWLELGAASGSDLAQFNAGAALDPYQPPWAEDGGGAPDPPKHAARAVGFYREAAAQGHAEALVHLGVSLYVGSGAAVDRAAAVRLWRRAIRGGVPGGPPGVHSGGAAEDGGEAEGVGGASETDLLAAQLLDAVAQGQGALLEAAWTEHGAHGGREETASPAELWRALPQPPQEQPHKEQLEQQEEQEEEQEGEEQAPPMHMLLPGAPFRNAGFRWRSK